ncbi:MAG: serine protease [Candidatus Competibacteraceae bacterium]|nr:serine protease [Candidatus Competibacteraceae bacterium]
MQRFWRIGWFLLVIFALPVQGAGLPQVIEGVRPSVVGVGTVQQTRRPPADFRGSGFVVGDGQHVVTNAHVVPDRLNSQRNEFLAVFAGRGKRFETRRASTVAVDRVHDLALLKIEGRPLPALRLGNSDRVREGESVAFTGFPIGVVLGLFPATHRGIIAAITPVAFPVPSAGQLDPALIRALRDPYDVFQLDATAYPGNSGSPLYEADTGRVIGVINKVFVKSTKEAVIQDPSGITYAIPAR